MQQTQQTQFDPTLDALAVRYAVDGHARYSRSLARSSYTHEFTSVRTLPIPTHYHSVTFGNHVVDRVSQIRESQSK